MAATLFERLAKGRPPPVESRPRLEASSELARELQRLHDWLQHWAKPTISMRDICYRGPNSIRDRRRVVELTEILVGHGWLIPNQAHRRDRKEWQIVRGLGGGPTVAAVATAAGMRARPRAITE